MIDRYAVSKVKVSIPATIWFFVIELENTPIAVNVPPKINKYNVLPAQFSISLNPKFPPCSGNIKSRSSGKQSARADIMIKKAKHPDHFPITSIQLLTGAENKVSSVPNRLSSAKHFIVMNGISAGAPNNSPTINEDSGGSNQSVLEKVSIKNRNPSAKRERK